jgi:hypothetical protein
MAIRERNKLKGWFQTGSYPTQDQFWDWLDSFIHKTEDQVSIENIAGLRNLLDAKADLEAYMILYQQVQQLRQGSGKIYRLDIIAPLTDEELNTAYPDAKRGTQVICPGITQGGELYEKYDDDNHAWFRLYMTKPSAGGSGGNLGEPVDMEIDNYV